MQLHTPTFTQIAHAGGLVKGESPGNSDRIEISIFLNQFIPDAITFSEYACDEKAYTSLMVVVKAWMKF